MARKPTLIEQLPTKLTKLKASEVNALSRVSSLDTDSKEFGQIFSENPALALAAKGIDISPEEAKSIKKQLSKAAPSGGKLAATEVEVSVKVKF